MASSAVVQRFVVFGDIGHQYPMTCDEAVPFVVGRLAEDGTGGTRAVEFLRPSDSVCSQVVLVERGREILRYDGPGLATWQGTAFGRQFVDDLSVRLDHESMSVDLSAVAPLMVLRVHVAADSMTEVLMCTRLRAAGALFTRVARFRAGNDRPWPDLIQRALAESPAFRFNVLTETEGCVGLTPNIEIETKLALTGGVSAWSLASHLSTLVGSEALPGFIPDVGNEMQRWQTYQHTWEVTGPAADVGYLALIQSGLGHYDLKCKRFAEDGLRREETFRFRVGVEGDDLDEIIAREFPSVTARRLPSHRRSKFDVNVESIETGHFFGIEIDEVTLDDESSRLSQLEIEYHRSRVHEGLSIESIEPELMRLTALIERYLADRGEPAERTHYSKLSFLRDVVADGTSRFAMPPRRSARPS
jgi:hypothetical protein